MDAHLYFVGRTANDSWWARIDLVYYATDTSLPVSGCTAVLMPSTAWVFIPRAMLTRVHDLSDLSSRVSLGVSHTITSTHSTLAMTCSSSSSRLLTSHIRSILRYSCPSLQKTEWLWCRSNFVSESVHWVIS